jgi:hypothetical protein
LVEDVGEQAAHKLLNEIYNVWLVFFCNFLFIL